jgi:hypothetical protein
MRKTLIAMLGLVAIGMWAFPAVAGVTSDPPPAKEYQPLDGRSGPVGASAMGGNSKMTLSGTTLKASAVDVTQWFMYPGACQDRAGGGPPGPWTPKTTAVADSLDTYNTADPPPQGAYSRVDLSLKESLWNTPAASGTTPAIPVGTRALWCGKFEPNFVVDVGYPNQTFQILYIDTGAHGADYTLTYVMNQSTEIDYDYVHLIGGGASAVDPVGNSRAKLDELVATHASGSSLLLCTWTASITTNQVINTVGGYQTSTGSASAQPGTVTCQVTIAAQHRALYFLFTADCGYSSEDGLWPVGHGVIFDEMSVSDNFAGSPNFVNGGLYHDQAANNALDTGVTPNTNGGIRGAYGAAGFMAARVAPGVGDLWQIVQGNFASTSDQCQPQKNDSVDLMFFGVDASSKKTIPGIDNSIVSCTFPVPVGTASIVALWGEYLDLPRGAGYVQQAEYRFYKGGSWSNWENTSAGGGVITSVIKTWLVDGDELAAAVQGDSVQVRYNLTCIPFFATDGVTCGQVDYGILYDDFRLEVRSGIPAPLLGIFPSQGPQSTFIDGTQGGTNCGAAPCWPGIRGSALGTPAQHNIAIHDNVNCTQGDSTGIGLATGLRKNGMGINWRKAFQKSDATGGEVLLAGTRPSNGAGQFGGFNPNFDVPRMIFRLFDPTSLQWSNFDSTELYADNLVVAAGDSIVTAAFGAPVFRMTWPPLDKAGQNLPNGFTINGVGAYNNLAFLPRGTRMQYYWKAVDIAGGTIHQFSSDNIAREVEDLPILPNSGGIKAPDIIEFDVLPRKYPSGSALSLLNGKSNTPILNLDGAHTAWSFQYDPMTQALRGLGVRADRYRLLQGLGQGNNFGGHELTGPPDNQRADRASNYFPNLTEYPLVSLMAGWYRIIIQSSHNRTAQLDDEPDARALEEWWVTDTGSNGGDRCIFVSGDDYFNALLNTPPGEASNRRRSYGQNVLGVNSAVGSWNGTVSVPYPTVEDRFANPAAGPGLLAGYTYPVDGGCPTPNRFDALSKSGGADYQNAAFYPLFAGVNDVAAVATSAERDPGGSGDNDRNKALGYGFSIQYIRKAGIPATAANYVRSGVEERMRVMYKFLTSCRGQRSGAPADTAKCWPCPTDANMTGNWAALSGFQTNAYGPLYAIQDNQAATGIEPDDVAAAPRVNKLEGNFPNPFNPQTTIKFSAAQAGKVTLRIFNVGGQLVRTLSAKAEVGANEVRWNGKRDDGVALSSGIYFYKVKFADGSESGSRMALVK